MKTENKVLMAGARESLAGKWGLAIGAFLVYMLICTAVQSVPVLGPLVSLVITGPLIVGLAMFSLALSRKQDARMSQIFDGFNKFAVSLKAYLLVALFTFLWALLLIIPGIIAAISYSQVFYILAEDNTIGALDAIKKSKQMMYGYKWKYVCMDLRFLGWALLSVLTLGIGFIWLVPYMEVSKAKFYDDVSGKGVQNSGSSDILV